MKRFSTRGQIVALTLVWAALLFGVDLVQRPRAIGDTFKPGVSSGAGAPRLSLWINHLCCIGCLDDLAGSLARFPWAVRNGFRTQRRLPPREAFTETAEPKLPPAGAGDRVDVAVTDIRLVDFVALDRAVRDAGLVAGRIEVSGIPHVRFAVEVKHACCSLCAASCRRGLDVLQNLRGAGEFSWLDSVSFAPERKTVTAHARYGAAVDVTELMAGLDRVGFAPVSLTAVVDPER